MYVLSKSTQFLSREVCEKLGLVNFKYEHANWTYWTRGFGKISSVVWWLGKIKHRVWHKNQSRCYTICCSSSTSHFIAITQEGKSRIRKTTVLAVITSVTEWTPWCAPIVVMPKSSGDVRIYVDLTKLNAVVCRERHILPLVEHLLGQVTRATMFSKIDANSGFYQIPLSNCTDSWVW